MKDLPDFSGASLFGRLAVGIVVGFVLLHSLTLAFYSHEKMVAEAGVFAASTAERALTIADAASDRPELLGLLSTPYFELSLQDELVPRPRRVWPHSEEIGVVLRAKLAALGFEDPDAARFWYVDERRETRLELQLPQEGRWLTIRATGPGVRGHTILATFWTSLLVLLILLAVLWATRRFTRVLPRLADAAERVGRSAVPQPLPEQGPHEVRRLVAAFNAMQGRVDRMLAERNTMLGALSHDVRTLITRLGLRLESLPDSAVKAQASRDIEEVTILLDQSLAFARNEAGGERVVALDLGSMLEALIDDCADQGANAEFEGQAGIVVQGEPAGLRRAFMNLVENAMRYGGSVKVLVDRNSASEVQVDVCDPGQGIAEEDRLRAFEPFERLEPSRNRHTGGVGLGLSIARRIIERHGGRIEFLKMPAGFVVRTILPAPELNR